MSGTTTTAVRKAPRGRKDQEAAERFAERRRREDDAPRLQGAVPALESLKFDFDDHRAGSVSSAVAHIRRVVVQHAPAHFEVTCTDPSCDGGHDLTRGILRALQERAPTFKGEDPCRGYIRGNPCERSLSYVASATYRP